jgi:hypothetical protein
LPPSTNDSKSGRFEHDFWFVGRHTESRLVLQPHHPYGDEQQHVIASPLDT